MGKPIPYDYRIKIIERKQSGCGYKEIASEFGFSESAVKKLWRRYQQEGEGAFQPRYSNCGRTSPFDQEVRDAIEKTRDNKQGASYVHAKLAVNYAHRSGPSMRTLQRWWVAEGTARPKGRVAGEEKKVGADRPTTPGK